MRRVLVTGAGGFVGRHLTAELVRRLDEGDRIVALTHGDGPTPSARCETRPLDLLDAAATRGLVEEVRPTHVVHLAARSSVQGAAGAPEETWRVNLVGSLHLAEAVRRHAAGATLLFVSSGEVYGRAFLSGRPLGEGEVPQPANAYARTKLAGEMMLADVLPSETRLVVIRAFNHTGPGQDERFVLPSFAGQIARVEAAGGAGVIEVGDLTASRDFLDVRDVVAAYRGLILRSDALPRRVLYNVASGTTRRIADILDGLRALAEAEIEVRVAPDRLRPSEIPVASADPGLIRRDTGWEPVVPWDETLRSLMAEARRRSGSGGPTGRGGGAG